MAAPVDTTVRSYGFRDAKGQVAKVRIIIGAATPAAIETDAADFTTKSQAVSNAHVYQTVDPAPINKRTYGTSAEYNTVEDKMQLTFTDTVGNLHRFEIPAPKSASFLADQETVNPAQTDVAALVTAIGTYVYGRYNDTAPLAYVGGVRVRRKLQRKMNIFVKDPTLTEPAE